MPPPGAPREPQAPSLLEHAIDGLLLLAGVACFFSISVMQAALVPCLLLWAGRSLARRSWPRLPLAAPLLAFTAATLLSALRAEHVGKALAGSRDVLLPWLVFLVAERTRASGRRALLQRTLEGATLAAALVGFVESARRGLDHRIQGTLGHYMTYAGVILSGGLLASARLLLGQGLRQRLLSGVAATASLLALLLTQTRSAWLGWIAGAGALLVLWRRQALLVLPALALAAYLLSPAPVRERIESIFDRKNVTTVERTYMWRAGSALWLDHFWTGVGPGHLRAAYPAYKLPDDPWLPERKFTHLHDNPLQVAAERGVLGLFAWIWIWVSWAGALRAAWRATPASDRLGRASLAASLAAVLAFHVSGLFEYNFGNSEVITLVWMLVGAVDWRGPCEPGAQAPATSASQLEPKRASK